MTTTPGFTPGTVYLVGAGPGDPGLITLRGIECLRMAEVVLYDYLVNPATLQHAPESAELFGLGHHSTGRDLSPDQIVERMVAEALSGKTVVRLKGGDPSIFGRAADEVGALRDAGIPLEIVPGITAGLAVGAFAEIPITHHDDASAVALIAGQERHTKTQSCLDYGVLAEFPGTLIFYMGVRKAADWSRALIENGKSPDTPVAIVRRCTWPQQKTIRCTLGTVVDVISEQKVRPPTIFVVGKVAGRTPDLSWFTARPLFGTRVLVTGSTGTSQKLSGRLASLGAGVVVRPAIRITDPADWSPVDDALGRLDDYDWLVFSSSNGVDYFFKRLLHTGGDLRRLSGVKLAAIGPGTSERLGHYHLRSDLVPEQFHAESLAEALAAVAPGQRFLLARASRGREVLSRQLQEAGGAVDQVVVYGSVDVEEADPDVVKQMADGEIDWVTVASSATAASLARLYGDALKRTKLASISPITTAALEELGYQAAVEASSHTMDGLAQAIGDTAKSDD